MPQVLVVKLQNGNTIIHCCADGAYPADSLDADQIVTIQKMWEAHEFDPADFQVAAAAYCDAALLDIDGTDLDADISIQDGAVVNARHRG